ncbi:hypothetical protein ACIGXF_36660 [Streptomyces sp. NPDC053086]
MTVVGQRPVLVLVDDEGDGVDAVGSRDGRTRLGSAQAIAQTGS